MAVAEERETIINANDADDIVRIWTMQKRYLGRLRRNDKFKEVASGSVDGSEWAAFEIAFDNWFPDTGAKRIQNITDEERAARSERAHRHLGK